MVWAGQGGTSLSCTEAPRHVATDTKGLSQLPSRVSCAKSETSPPPAHPRVHSRIHSWKERIPWTHAPRAYLSPSVGLVTIYHTRCLKLSPPEEPTSTMGRETQVPDARSAHPGPHLPGGGEEQPALLYQGCLDP